MNKKQIHLSIADMGTSEEYFIQKAFITNWITTGGPNVDDFEEDLEEFFDESVHVAALNSGTSAIHLALILLGIGNGDEVICQDFTFAATAFPILYLNAKPVFVDSEMKTWNMSPIYLKKAIEKRFNKTGKLPKAIIPVHAYGMPADMDEINAVANDYNIPVIEDAAAALGSMYKRKKCGTLGNISILSFNGNKIITTAGGGAIISKDERIIKQAKLLASQARENTNFYSHQQTGYNYRLSNICAAIGRGQMIVLPERIERRRKINQYYRKRLEIIEGVNFQKEPNRKFYSNYWMTTITVDQRKTGGVTANDIQLALEKENIESRPLWNPMHRQIVFSNSPFYGDGTSEHLFKNGLCLPSGSILTDKELRRVANVIKRTLK
ncbi:MAG: DegT/DnrJ/EryC1/StrS family aminotransferase [Dysgonamonadaceae bacterium]|jgi:dTDP-4-amino-4,6-dideoxygalactose transaminase|nr:DegT/DnrJ/EryC1/StrS family aminotransferase [Dysgonamonadaceae bacterium]